MIEWDKNEDIDGFYRNLSLVDKGKYTEKYEVKCKTCGFKDTVKGGRFKPIGKAMGHHINDKNEHDMVIKDVSEPV